MTHSRESIVLGGGCFWCIEAGLKSVPGVISATSGYAAGHQANPDYKAVCAGDTGHAEVVEVIYSSSIITLTQLLDFFFHLHDPTSLNRQGEDVGTQYRSIILYTDDCQKEMISSAIKSAQMEHSKPIVTEVAPLEKFYAAETYHHNYYQDNPNQPYCMAVISPKLRKFQAYLAGKSNH